MLIPSYTPVIRSSRSMCSSHCSQVYCTHRPAIKDKRRSLVPTVSSLLIGTIVRNNLTETSSDEIKEIHSMETPIKNHEIPERPDALHNLKPSHDRPNEGNLNFSCSRRKSHRTEDISVREDEDGVRTHFCPLDESRDSPKRIEGEGLSADPLKLDSDAELFLKDFCLKSEEITSLVAEKPPLSESDDESNNLGVDLFASKIYASYQNRQLISADNSLKFLLDHQMTSLPSKKITENVMTSWDEDSSEEEESLLIPTVSDESAEMQQQQKYAELVESDMEEFERTAEPRANGFEESKHFSNNKQIKETIKNLLNDKSSIDEISESPYNDEKFNVTNIPDVKVEKSTAIKNSSVLKTASKSNIPNRETSKEHSDSECCPLVLDEQEQIDDLLKAVVEQASLNATEKLKKSDDETHQNSESDFTEDKSKLKSDSVVAERHLLKDTNTQTKKTDDVLVESNIIWSKERECEKPEDNAPTYKVYINTENPAPDASVKFKVSRGPGAERKEEMKGNFTMEPISLLSKNQAKSEETQPDLATALRFMTEVYPNTNDDELYFDTLSTSSDHSSEKETSKPSTVSKKYRDIQEKLPIGNIGREAAITESGPFEPVIVEDQRTVKRPRNKFSKFFQSFKRRLAKKP